MLVAFLPWYSTVLPSAVSLARLWYPSVPKSNTAQRANVAVSIPTYVHSHIARLQDTQRTHSKVGRYSRPDQATTAATLILASLSRWGTARQSDHSHISRPGDPQVARLTGRGKRAAGPVDTGPLHLAANNQSGQSRHNWVTWMNDYPENPDKDGRDRGRFVSLH